jgi:hypothetical protein
MADSQQIIQQMFNRFRMFMAGMQFGGRRDLYELFGYNRKLSPADFVARYVRQDIAKRIINAPVLSTWADPPTVTSDDQAFEDAWNILCDEYPIWNKIIRLDKLAGLGSYAVAVIGVDDGQTLDKEVKPPEKPTLVAPVDEENPPVVNAATVTTPSGRKLLYMQPYHELAASISSYEKNNTSPRFMQPLQYTITPGKFDVDVRVSGISMSRTAGARTPFNVNYSRILHVAEDLLEDNNYGRSRMECVYNLLDDVLKLAGGSAELFWITANRGLHVDIDKDMELDADDAGELSKEIQEYIDDQRRFIRTRGAKVTNLGTDVADPKGPFDVTLSLISSATGIPKMILTGSTLGQLASQQDRANWADRIGERITEYAEPVLFKPFVRQLINLGVLPVPKGRIYIKWPEAFKLNPLERAQTSAQMARSAANLTKAAAGMPEGTSALFSPDEMRNIVGFDKHPPTFPKEKTDGQAPGTGKAAKPNAPAASIDNATNSGEN